jgi:Flp pilus assembly protein TadB
MVIALTALLIISIAFTALTGNPWLLVFVAVVLAIVFVVWAVSCLCAKRTDKDGCC